MADGALSLKEVRNHSDLMAFVRFPWEIYREDCNWVPPLIRDQLSKFKTTSPFCKHAEMRLWVAKKGQELLGRIGGIIDHNYVAYHQEKVGSFGFFECYPDPEVAMILLRTVTHWLKERGMEQMIGPLNPSTNDECGLLIEGFGHPPCLMMPYNPPYYPELLEGFGLKKAMDLYAYLLEKEAFRSDQLNRVTERLRRKEPDLRVRPIRLRAFDQELAIVKELYNQAWSKNWGFVPLTEEEIDEIAKNLKPLVVPELVLFALSGEREVGFSVALPDYNEVLKHLDGRLGPFGMLKFLYYRRKIQKIRVMLLGVVPEFRRRGVEGLLYMETFRRGLKKGYEQAECSWILESNPLMQHGIEAMGGKRYKTYRIYETKL